LINENQDINWRPEHLKKGRFGKGLEGAPDWNVSRDRYWGTAMPVWKCQGRMESQKQKNKSQRCGNIKVIGSFSELEQLSGQKIDNFHRPGIDKVTFKCEKCGEEMKRIPQVFDCWMESGSMSFAQFHYPFENKEKFEKSFPTDFISEYIAQTRAWFYVMHVMAVGVFGKKAYKNVLTTGVIAGEDGRKMSKSFGNFTDPNEVLEKYSADALRFYFLSSPLLNAQNLNFSTEAIQDIQRRFLGTLWNSYSFLVLYANIDGWKPKDLNQEEILKKGNVLDKWILSELNQLIQEVDEGFQKYSIIKPAKKMEKFVDNLSNWYIRRSRRRFWKSENDNDKKQAYKTLYLVLIEFSKILAPYCPFIAENIYQNLTGEESVHLINFPIPEKKFINKKINSEMEKVRKVIESGLSLRAENQIKVRQPLSAILVVGSKFNTELEKLLIEEVNVKSVLYKEIKNKKIFWKEVDGFRIGLDTNINNELKQEGKMRDLIRQMQQARKEANFKIDDRIKVYYQNSELFKEFKDEIKKEVLIRELVKTKETPSKFDYKKEIKVKGTKFEIWLAK